MPTTLKLITLLCEDATVHLDDGPIHMQRLLQAYNVPLMYIGSSIILCVHTFFHTLTEKGAQVFCNIRSLLATATKQGLNLLTTIQDVLAGHPPHFHIVFHQHTLKIWYCC